MDLGALIVVIGTGALVDALADVQLGKDVAVTLLAASLLLLALSVVGRATGEYGIATALAFLYLLASLLKNYKNVPMLTALVHSSGSPVQAVAPASYSTTGQNPGFSTAPTAGRLGIN